MEQARSTKRKEDSEGKVGREGEWKGGDDLRRTFDFDDAFLAIHGQMIVCGGAWHVFLGVPLDDGH